MIPSGLISLPGFVDLHVHFREPGFSYKETIRTGSMAAQKGGYTDVFTMPNLSPVPDCVANLQTQLDIIQKDAVIGVHPYASITKGQKGEGELVDMVALAPLVPGFSDDGRGIQDRGLMREAMEECKRVDSIIVEHCEVNELLRGGYIHDGEYAKAHGHRGICSESEWKEVERNINLAAQTGCRLHICHVSTKESVELIRQAKKSNLPVSAETAPHYLLLTDNDLLEDGKWKMNPPLRSQEDKDALLAGLADGSIDCIATDHAPHSMEEKSKGLEKSAFGIVGLEVAFPLIYTYLIKTGILPWDVVLNALTINPRRIMRMKGEESMVTWNLDEEWTIQPQHFLSMGKATPFEGWKVFGKTENV